MEKMTISEMGKRGAAARNKNLTPEQRSAAAKKAAVARWKNKKSPQVKV